MGNLYQSYLELRTKRLALQREADELEQQEKDILYEITKNFDTANAGVELDWDNYKMTAKRKDVVVVNAWEILLPFIKETGQVDLLQKRITESAVKLRWDQGLMVPGTEKSYKWAVTVTKKD